MNISITSYDIEVALEDKIRYLENKANNWQEDKATKEEAQKHLDILKPILEALQD